MDEKRRKGVIVSVRRKVIPNERSFPFGVTLAPVTLHFVRNFDVTKFLFKIPRHAIGMNLSGEGESSAVSFMVVGEGGVSKGEQGGKELRSILSVLIRSVLENDRNHNNDIWNINRLDLLSYIVRITNWSCVISVPSKFYFSIYF